jgi:hypothetical protein
LLWTWRALAADTHQHRRIHTVVIFIFVRLHSSAKPVPSGGRRGRIQ